MTPLLATIVLTVLAAVVIVLTRVRLAGSDGAAGRLAIPQNVLNAHTFAGGLALVGWVAFLLLDIGWLGLVSLVLWWVAVVAGLLILARWLPAKGRHSSGPTADTWGEGPGLSVLAHVGLLVGVLVFTVLYFAGSIP
ncbi:MAG TPA: hypothetical protein VFZ64_03145 [Nocardioidaceae bacterium]